MKRFALLVSILCLFGNHAGIYSQQASSITIKQLLSQQGYSATDADLQKLKQQYQVQSKSKAKDTVSASDSVSKKSEDTSEVNSIYEDILNNVILDPDSLLKNLPIFGLDMFAGSKPSTFMPPDYVATPADYPVGSGDEILINLWGRLNEEHRLKVDRDGKVNVPHIGSVSVAGLSFGDMQKTLLDRIQTIEGVQASISIGELRSIGIYVVGEVKKPGLYTLSSMSNVTNALFAAGGPSKRGSLRNIQVKRNGSIITTVDFYDFLLSGKDNTGLRLKSGDVVIVPIVKAMVAVAGNVRRSALYEIKADTKLKDGLALAGGMTPAAWTNRIQIERFKDNQYQAILDLESQNAKAIPDFDLQDGDIVKVFPVVIRNKNAVYLSGNVIRPGKYEFKSGMKVSDLLPDYQSLMPETYFQYAVVIRQDPPSFLDRIIPFNLMSMMDNHASPDNLALQPKDMVFVYARDFFEPDRNVTIGGAVTNPGTFKLLENMKIRDLIIKAGGLLEEASAERGELYRRSMNNEAVTTEKIEFCVRCAMEDDPQSNFALKKFDRVYIRTKTGWEEEKRIILRGEFAFPGEYILLKNETLDQLIERAGGFTNEAYLPAAIFSRPSVKNLEKQRIDQYIMQLELDAVRMTTEMAVKNQQIGDAQQMLAQQEILMDKLRVSETVGRIVIDLTKKENYKNLVLEDGDLLFVPKMTGTVSVIGEVYNPATFKFESGFPGARYYLERTGGIKPTAEKKNIYIVMANGIIITSRTANVMNFSMHPGDVLVVPQRIEYKNNFKVFLDSVDAIVKIATLVMAIGTLVIAINSAKK